MWIFMNDAALSIVANRNNDDELLVRARIEGDIDRVFPEARIDFTPEFDYAYRAMLPRRMVAEGIANNLALIPYDNFKDSIDPNDHDRHTAYMNIWFVMRDYQQDKQLSVANMRKVGRV